MPSFPRATARDDLVEDEGTPDSGQSDLPNPPIAEPRSESADLVFENPFSSLAVPATSRVKQVWAVGGGKGGVGKSLLASSLGIALSRTGHKVLVIDLDLGGANLHTALGVELPKVTIGDFIAERAQTLESCVSPTGIPNLEIISGAQDSSRVADLSFQNKVRLLLKIRELNADYVILDLGAGTGVNTVDFFLYSDVGIVLVVPEPTSIENAYRFIRTMYYRSLSLSPRLKPARELIVSAMDPKNTGGIRTPSELFRAVSGMDAETALMLKEEIRRICPMLVVNQARTQTDIDIGFSVKSVCKKYFGIDTDYVGYLDYDSTVWQAVRRKRPFMLEFPNSRLVSSVERISNFLVKRHGQKRTSVY